MSFFSNKTIVVPFDFSDEAMEAIKKAIDIGDSSTEIHVLHVVEPTPVTVSVDPSLPVLPTYDLERSEQAKSVMEQTISSGRDIKMVSHCLIGDPGHEISEYAKSIDADLIMMPSHGRTGLSRLFLGSVAERVLRLACRPVLILRHPDTK